MGITDVFKLNLVQPHADSDKARVYHIRGAEKLKTGVGAADME